MITCEQVDALLEAVADGDRMPAEAEAHVSACPRCAAALADARAIEAALATRPIPAPPSNFTAAVMAKVHEERWRAEQVVDLGFNLAIAAGVLLIIGGVAGLAWTMGLISIGDDMMTLLSAASRAAIDRLAPQMPTIVLSATLLTMTLALWWWVDDEIAW